MFAASALQGTHGSVIPAIRANLKKARAGLRRGVSASRPHAKNAPASRGVFAIIGCRCRPKPDRAYAAAFAAEPLTTCGAAALVVVIGMLRGFLASGISRTRST